MKRIVRIKSEGNTKIEVVATINSNGSLLNRAEVDRIRECLADRVMAALVDLPYSTHAISRMKVSE